jgi:predicted amidohydrolase YtcJ
MAAALVNGKIVTVDEQFSVVEAIAVEGERVTATGSTADVLAAVGPRAEVTDLAGATVIPGLIDNHSHFVRASEHAEVRLEGITSRDVALETLRRVAAALPDGQWLVVLGGWHEEQWGGDRREFTVADLDAVAGSRPAFIMAAYDHALVNSAWLDATGVPADAEIRLTGRIGGGIVALNRSIGGFPVPADREATARATASWLNSVGLTTVFDPGGLDFVFDAYERADAKRPIRPLRWSVTHAEGMTAAHVERARRLGITVQLRSMGVIRAKPAVLVPLRQIADSGLSWGLGTDGTRAAQVNPFVTLFWAVTGRSLGGEQGQEEVLTREEALIAHTRGNACPFQRCVEFPTSKRNGAFRTLRRLNPAPGCEILHSPLSAAGKRAPMIRRGSSRDDDVTKEHAA